MDASSWLDTRDQAKVTDLIEKLRAQNWTVWVTDYAHYAGGAEDERYLAWLYLTDRECLTAVGVSIFDLSDPKYGDFYESGMSPGEAARAALENDDTYSAIFGG
jgi:hypothetical protein